MILVAGNLEGRVSMTKPKLTIHNPQWEACDASPDLAGSSSSSRSPDPQDAPVSMDKNPLAELVNSDGEINLEKLLAAWQSAIERLQGTHETLRQQVQRLTDELETKNRELARKSRLADLGQMAAHVAHEVRNGLMPTTLYLSLLKRHLENDVEGRQIVEKIDAGFTALDATVNDLLHFTSDRDPATQWFSLGKLIEELCDSLRPQMAAQDIVAGIDIPKHALVFADQEMLRRAVLNLILNAIDVMPQGGELTITSWQGKNGFELEVADTGPGLPDDVQDHLFEPFFSTKSGGTGLGLTIASRIAEVHGGNITAMNCPDGGAAFTLRIPPQTQTQEAAA